MLVAAVLQPALKFTADRANPPASFSRSFHDQLRMLLAMCFCFFDLTASDIAWGTWACQVHGSYGHHLFVTIDLIVLHGSKCPPHGNSFLWIHSKPQLASLERINGWSIDLQVFRMIPWEPRAQTPFPFWEQDSSEGLWSAACSPKKDSPLPVKTQSVSHR